MKTKILLSRKIKLELNRKPKDNLQKSTKPKWKQNTLGRKLDYNQIANLKKLFIQK